MMSFQLNTFEIKSGMRWLFLWKCHWPVANLVSILHSNNILQSVTTHKVLFQNENNVEEEENIVFMRQSLLTGFGEKYWTCEKLYVAVFVAPEKLREVW